jgi:hypothetical protein
MFYYILYVIILYIYILRYVIFYTIDALGCLSVPKLRSAVVSAGFACFVSKFQKATLGMAAPASGATPSFSRMGLNHNCAAWQGQDGTQSYLCCLTRTAWDSIGCVLLDKNMMGLNRMCVAWQQHYGAQSGVCCLTRTGWGHLNGHGACNWLALSHWTPQSLQ